MWGTRFLGIHTDKQQSGVPSGLDTRVYTASDRDIDRLSSPVSDWVRKMFLGILHLQHTCTGWCPTRLQRRAEVHSTETKTRQLSTLHRRLSEIESRMSSPFSSTLSSSLIRL